jgi:hypothetical protein
MKLVRFSSAFVLAFAGIVMTGSTAEAHQCISVELIEVPQVVVAGQTSRVLAGVTNCGEATRAGIEFYLVNEDGRIHVGSERVKLRHGQAERIHATLRIPPNTRPGRYSLMMIGKTPSGFTSFDSEVVHVRNP